MYQVIRKFTQSKQKQGGFDQWVRIINFLHVAEGILVITFKGLKSFLVRLRIFHFKFHSFFQNMASFGILFQSKPQINRKYCSGSYFYLGLCSLLLADQYCMTLINMSMGLVPLKSLMNLNRASLNRSFFHNFRRSSASLLKGRPPLEGLIATSIMYSVLIINNYWMRLSMIS